MSSFAVHDTSFESRGIKLLNRHHNVHTLLMKATITADKCELPLLKCSFIVAISFFSVGIVSNVYLVDRMFP